MSVVGVAAGRRLHRGGGDHLHQVVDDHVAQRADRVVEVAAVLDPEALGHRDLHGRDVVAVPDRLEHRVREPQVEDLDEAHLPEEVVDPVELGLVEVLVHLLVERRAEATSWPNGFSTTTRADVGQARLGQPLDDHPEQRRRDLEVEDGAARVLDRLGDALVGAVVAEVAGQVGQPRREAVEDLVVDRLAAVLDALARVLAQVVDGPVVDRHADDRAVQQAAALQPVERVERHHLGEVAGDAEDHEHVRGLCAGRVLLGGRGRPEVVPRCSCGGLSVSGGRQYGADLPGARWGRITRSDDSAGDRSPRVSAMPSVDMTEGEFRELFEAVSNWGRWDDDAAGRTELSDPARTPPRRGSFAAEPRSRSASRSRPWRGSTCRSPPTTT